MLVDNYVLITWKLPILLEIIVLDVKKSVSVEWKVSYMASTAHYIKHKSFTNDGLIEWKKNA